VISTPVYTTREAVKESMDWKETARNNALVDRAVQSAARDIEGALHRRFYPELTTRRWDWPNYSLSPSWVLELDDNELISIDTLTAGGVVIPSTNYKLRREDNKAEPPYTRVEIDLSTASSFAAGPTFQESVEILGWYGFDDKNAPAGATAGAINGSVTTLNVSDSGIIGVGSLLRIDNERMLVSGKRMLDTAQNLQGNLTAFQNNEVVPVQDGTAFFMDEIILIDAERMKIVDIAGNNLIVKRGWDGSTLAAHTTGTADIFAPRALTIVRAFVGTSAASHNSAVSITQHVPPGLISEYANALAMNDLRASISGYTPDMFDSKALRTKREAAYTAYGRKARSGAV